MPLLNVSLMGRRKSHGYQSSSAFCIFQSQGTAVHLDDLVTDSKANAGAADTGTAFVEFLFHQRNFILRNSRAEIPDADSNAAFQP